MDKNIYACIDLKSFYASVECKERGLDPLTTNLVVADISRTEKTICLAVSPSLKSYGIPGRARLFEVVQKVKEENIKRKINSKNHKLIKKTCNNIELKENNNLELDYIIAPPRMSYYMKYSTQIYNVYLKYLDEADIYVYSIDEVFLDITNYLKYYNLEAEEFVAKMIKDVYETTGITATSGIGTNLYLAKIAMDIEAKKKEPNEYGVRIAFLDESKYRKKLWNHTPITDFWRVGKGYANKLNNNGIYTMGDIAKCSVNNEEILYKLFGVNAETLIDHAWGYEPCTIKDIKAYKPTSNSLSSGQVLHCPYDYKKTKLIVKEMMELLSLDLVSKHLLTDQITLTIIYDIENLKNPKIKRLYKGEITQDQYGRLIPKQSHGTINLESKTSSSKILIEKIADLYTRIVNENLLIKKISISVNKLIKEEENKKQIKYEQCNIFTNYDEVDKKNYQNEIKEQEERNLQNIMINIKQKYGKNAILKGMNLEEGSTTIQRNRQIGGHSE